MILSSISIPYSLHTCLITFKKEIHFLENEDHCLSHDDNHQDHKELHLSKTACCDTDKGLIDFDASLVLASFSNVISPIFIVNPLMSFQLNSIDVNNLLSTKYTPFAVKLHSVPIRIMQQSFLC